MVKWDQGKAGMYFTGIWKEKSSVAVSECITDISNN